MMTNFGYSVLADSMPDIISEEEFNRMTANKYALDSRVASIIKSVTASIRAYCGWHIGPTVKCELKLNVKDLHIYNKFSDVIIQLPYKFIENIDNVYVNAYKEEDGSWKGDEYEFSFKYDGSLTLYDACVDSRKSSIVVIADVGINDLDALKSIIVSKTSQVLNGTYGIQSETAGGVSISYNSSYITGAKANSFMTDDKELLNSYKIIELL